MKQIFFFMMMAFCLITSSPVKAQRLTYDAHAGMNISGFHGGQDYTVYNKSHLMGYEIGGGIRYDLGSNFSLISGLTVQQTGGKFSVMSNYIGEQGMVNTEFPEIRVKNISFEIPIKLAYDINLSPHFQLTPMAGIYGRCSVFSVNSRIRTEDGETEKWNCYKDYQQKSHHVDAFTRWDVGSILGLEGKIEKHYLVGAEYKCGFLNQSSQYNLKNETFSFKLGYIW